MRIVDRTLGLGDVYKGRLVGNAAKLDAGQGQDEFLANLKKLADLGFMGLNVDAEYGGTEAGTVAFSLAISSIARGCASTAVTVSVTNMVAEVIQSVASAEQKQNYLPKFAPVNIWQRAFA